MLFKYGEEQIHSFLTRTSGPAAATDSTVNMITNSDLTNTVFEYVVPSGTMQTIIYEIDLAHHVGDPGMGTLQAWGTGGAALTNGCTLEVIDTDNSQLLDLFDGQTLTSNRDFVSFFSKSEVFSPAIGQILKGVIKFRDFPLTLTPGQIIRWTNQDDLTGGANADMRCLVRGVRGATHS